MPAYDGGNALGARGNRGLALGGLPGHDLDDLAQRLDEVPTLTGAEHGQQALIDARRSRLDGRESRLASLREAHSVHAGVAACALSLQQPFFDQPTDDVGQRRAVDPGLLDKTRLTDVGVLGDAGEDGVLTRREVRLTGFIREQYLGTLTGPMQQMQGRNVEGTRAMVVLHRMLRR